MYPSWLVFLLLHNPWVPLVPLALQCSLILTEHTEKRKVGAMIFMNLIYVSVLICRSIYCIIFGFPLFCHLFCDVASLMMLKDCRSIYCIICGFLLSYHLLCDIQMELTSHGSVDHPAQVYFVNIFQIWQLLSMRTNVFNRSDCPCYSSSVCIVF